MRFPILPRTNVGSWPKPEYVKKENARGKLDRDSKRATEEFIRRQEELGFDILVDGEFYRGDMATDYARALGLRLSGKIRSYDDRWWRKGYVEAPLERRGQIQVEQFKFAQSLAEKPVKAMLTGPTTLANWNYDAFYFDRKELVYAWAEIIRQEALELERAGAKFIQIDEPAIGERIDEISGLFINALAEVTDGLKSHTITHICYGDFVRFYDYLKDLPVDQIDIELSADLDLGLKRSELLQKMKKDPLTKYKFVKVGIVDVRPYSSIESLETIIKRIYTALEILDPEKTLIGPDCGYRATKDCAKADAKNTVISKAVDVAREQLIAKGYPRYSKLAA